jgi:divalent metal cation (Fe/Co/Zn/Cd) transporter
MVVHDYGPGRRMISLHGEVPGNMNIFELHDVIDCIEVELYDKLGCEAVIHMDPVDVENPLVAEISAKLEKIIKEIDKDLSFHDLRTVSGPTHTNIIFDLAVPYGCKISDSKIVSLVKDAVCREIGDTFLCVIKAERLYTGR